MLTIPQKKLDCASMVFKPSVSFTSSETESKWILVATAQRYAAADCPLH